MGTPYFIVEDERTGVKLPRNTTHPGRTFKIEPLSTSQFSSFVFRVLTLQEIRKERDWSVYRPTVGGGDFCGRLRFLLAHISLFYFFLTVLYDNK